jgi:hypothetical protein
MDPPRISPDGRWEVRWECTKDFNSYFESDSRYEASVINRATKKRLVSFTRSEFANAAGSKDSGVSSLEFLPDGKTVRANFEDGAVKDVRLPDRDEVV